MVKRHFDIRVLALELEAQDKATGRGLCEDRPSDSLENSILQGCQAPPAGTGEEEEGKKCWKPREKVFSGSC